MDLQNYNYWDNEYIREEERKQIEAFNKMFQELSEGHEWAELTYNDYLKWDDTYDFIASLPNIKGE